MGIVIKENQGSTLSMSLSQAVDLTNARLVHAWMRRSPQRYHDQWAETPLTHLLVAAPNRHRRWILLTVTIISLRITNRSLRKRKSFSNVFSVERITRSTLSKNFKQVKQICQNLCGQNQLIESAVRKLISLPNFLGNIVELSCRALRIARFRVILEYSKIIVRPTFLGGFLGAK